MEKIKDYLFYVKNYSHDSGENFLLVGLKIIFCRVFFKIGPKYFCLYGLNDKIFNSKNYIQKHNLDAIQKNINQESYIHFSDDKIEFFYKCKKENIPTPDILAIVDIRNKVEFNNTITIKNHRELEELLKSLSNGNYVFKSTYGSYGMGMLTFKNNNGKFTNLIDKNIIDINHFKRHFLNNRDSFILQKKYENSCDIQHIMGKKALGTIRVVTYVFNNGSKVEVPYTFAKIPIGNSINDNFSHGDTGNLLCGIDPESGRMMKAYGKGQKKVSLTTFKAHPETGIEFEKVTIPRWKEIVSLSKDAAIKFFPLKTIGWDVAVCDEGLFLLEANWHYDPDGPQVTLGRGIKSELKCLYSR